MSIATLSSKFQISIPKDIREAMDFKAGQQLTFLRVGKSLRLVPVRRLDDLFGMCKGANTDDIRDRNTRREDSLPVPTEAQKAAFPENMRQITELLSTNAHP
jgi:AbrB family looped-hinge helix DNA binding protein